VKGLLRQSLALATFYPRLLRSTLSVAAFYPRLLLNRR
jgi:hypothetical protein